MTRTANVVGGLGLLFTLVCFGGCSTDSEFWDRSPQVAGERQPDWIDPPEPRPYAEAPEQQPQQPPYAQPPQQPAPYAEAPQQPAPYTPPPSAAPPSAAPSTGGPASAEEMDVLVRVNRIRNHHNLRPLRFNGTLWNAARDHSAEQQRHGYMGHGSPDPKRKQLGQRMALAGYHGRVFAEVVAWGYTDAATVVEGWMNSSGHRSILLDGELSEAAFSRIGKYWTGNFGSPAAFARGPAARPHATPRAAPRTRPPAPRAAPRARPPAPRTPAPRSVPPAPGQSIPDPFRQAPQRRSGG